MSIKHKIKIKKVTGIGVHGLATGDSLDLSDDPKGERRSPASDGESIRRDVPADDMNKENEEKFYEIDRPRFEEQDEKEYKKQLKKFFKGEDEDNT
jgi:hypothetical protein|tara:strand:- start:142 stop:429 length:288 start_codon:yes stop_codon:yes gene_type:complete